MIQRSFLRKINGMNHISYWDQLKKLKMYSLERRRAIYRIIYVWKVIEQQVPNVGNNRIVSKLNERLGRECLPPPVNQTCSKKVQNLIYASLPVHGQSSSTVFLDIWEMWLVAKWKLSRGCLTITWPLSQMSPWSQATRSSEGQSLIAYCTWPN